MDWSQTYFSHRAIAEYNASDSSLRLFATSRRPQTRRKPIFFIFVKGKFLIAGECPSSLLVFEVQISLSRCRDHFRYYSAGMRRASFLQSFSIKVPTVKV